MTDEDDTDGLAAEYVLGSLSHDERKDVAALRVTNPALDRAIEAWETRLAPLVACAPSVEPPPYVLLGIEQEIAALPHEPINAPYTSLWRGAAFAACASALAACMALFVVWNRELPRIPPSLSAQLKPNAAGAVLEDGPNIWTPFRFDVFVDLRASKIVVTPVAAAASATRHYQLWLIPKEHGVLPISLGVIRLPQSTTSPWLATYPPEGLPNTTLAVSLEPAGGSRIGRPSGPLVFVGKLLDEH